MHTSDLESNWYIVPHLLKPDIFQDSEWNFEEIRFEEEPKINFKCYCCDFDWEFEIEPKSF